MQAAYLAGFVEGPPPFDLVKGWLCEHFHCTPAQLAAEPADEVFRIWRLQQEYQRGLSRRNPKL